MIFGAGNSITNSSGGVNIGLFDMLRIAGEVRAGNVSALQNELASSVAGSGGNMLAIGGANSADGTTYSSMIGVSNTINHGILDSVNGHNNTMTDSNSVTLTGSNNSVANTNNTILLGDNHVLTRANNSVIIGSSDNRSTIQTEDIVSIGHNAIVNYNTGVAIGSNSIANTDAGALGYDSVTNTDSTSTNATWKSTLAAVSIGDTGETRQITNLAAGKQDTDAVNVAQLKQLRSYATYTAGDATTVIQNPDGSHAISVNYGDGLHLDNNRLVTDVQRADITNLNTRVNDLDKDISKVGANAAALAGLHPLDFDPDDKATFAVAGGFYKDQQATALGAFYRPNEETMFSVATTLGNADNMVNVGLSFKIGSTRNERKFKEQYKTAPISTVYVLEHKVELQQEQLNSQATEISQLKALVNQLMNK